MSTSYFNLALGRTDHISPLPVRRTDFIAGRHKSASAFGPAQAEEPASLKADGRAERPVPGRTRKTAFDPLRT